MKIFIIFAAFIITAAADNDTFDLKKDIQCRIQDGIKRVNDSRDASLDYVNKQQQEVLNMIQQVAGEMVSATSRLGKALMDYINAYQKIPQYKSRAARIFAVFDPFVKNTAKQVDLIRSQSLPIAIKKTPDAITEDLRQLLYVTAGNAYDDINKYQRNNDRYSCRYPYHIRLIADYYLFAAKNNGYCVDFLNYQIYGDAAEFLQLISDHFDQHMDLAEEAVNGQSDLETVLAVSISLFHLIDKLVIFDTILESGRSSQAVV